MMPCVKTYFLFIMTGVGKGCFNIFVGGIMMFNAVSGANILYSICGWCLIASGFIFLFLSRVKKMSDEDLERAMSVYA